MLTADLIRVQKDKSGEISVKSLHGLRRANVLTMATQLIEILHAERGNTQREVHDALAALDVGPREAKMKDALYKLLDDSSEWSEAPRDCATLRLDLFRAAAAARAAGSFDRTALLARFGVDPNKVHEALYADLPEQRRLLTPSVLHAETLVDRFDEEQARALLLAARAMSVQVPRTSAAVRWVVQRARFFGLLANAHATDDAWVTIALSGPAADFAAGKYGIAFANLLPQLEALPDYRLAAEVVLSRVTRGTFMWSKRRAETTTTMPLRPAVQTLREGLQELWASEDLFATADDMVIDECGEILIGADGLVVVPDLTLRRGKHAVHLELLEHATAAQLDARVAAWPENSRNLVVCYRENAQTACRKRVTPWLFPYKRQLATRSFREFMLRIFS